MSRFRWLSPFFVPYLALLKSLLEQDWSKPGIGFWETKTLMFTPDNVLKLGIVVVGATVALALVVFIRNYANGLLDHIKDRMLVPRLAVAIAVPHPKA
jgi:hypothetical protein